MASFLDRFRNGVAKSLQNTHELFNKAVYTYLGEKVVWNAENDDTYIDKGYRHNSTIYSIINIISKSASGIPFCIYEVQSENELARYKAMTSSSMSSDLFYKSEKLKKSALVEVNDTALHKLLKRPNPAQSYVSFLQELISFDRLTGNSYIYGISPETGANKGKYLELYVLPSHKMEIHSGGIFEPVKEYSLSYNGYYTMPAEHICHIKDFNPYYDGTGSHLYGMSPLKAGLRSLQTNNEATTTGVKYLQNQTARGVLMSDEGDLSAAQAQQLKDKFRQNYQGSNNAGDVVITPKKLSWINFGLNASDLSLIEQHNASIRDLCNIYNVPVQLLNNTDSSTYNNMKEAKKALYQNAVIPHLVKIREELNRWLVPKFGENLYLDFDFTVIPELQEETDKIVEQMAKSWWVTPNEKRQAMSYGIDEECPELDNYYIPLNLMKLQKEDEDYDMPEMNEDDEVDSIEIEVNEEEEVETKAKISARIEKILRDKVKEHNDKYGDSPSKRATYGMLSASFRRGVGAYNTNPSSVRPSVSSSDQWALARVNGLLHALRTGKFKNKPYDTDLLPSTHPLSSKSATIEKETFNNYPQGATNNARRMLRWREEHDDIRGGTSVGWTRANQLSNREALSMSTIKRTYSFLSRHKQNAVIDPQYKSTPWKDAGYVAYNLWGGQAMFAWAKRMASKND